MATARTVTIAGAACVRLLDPENLLAPDPQGSFGPPPTDQTLRLDLELTREPAPALTDATPIFDSTSLWKVHRLGQAHLFTLPHLTAVIDFRARQGRIHLRSASGPAFDFPLDEAVFSRLLAQRGLVIVHACGVALADRGTLMAGPSGVGKSTLADLWTQTPDACVLSDDRVAIGTVGERLVMAGTPWHGTARHASDRSADLTRVLMLEQASTNHYRSMPATEAAARLLAMCVIPYWHPPSAELALDAALGVSAHVPVGALGFTPDPSAVVFMADPTSFPD